MREHEREQAIQYLWGLAREAELGPRRSLHQGTHARSPLGTVGLMLGVLTSVAGGGALAYGLIHGPGLILLPLIGAAFTAVGLWRRYRRDRRWLALHEYGLVLAANQDPPAVVRWGDVVDVRDTSVRSREVTVTTYDGAVTIGPQFRDIETIGRRLVARLTELTLTEMRATVVAGGVAEHGAWRADRSGLSGDGWSADWDEVVDLAVEAGTARVLLNDDREPALDLGIGSSSTSRAFVTLIDELRRRD
jgi:hypothetical protein